MSPTWQERKSATIYQFPLGSRRASNGETKSPSTEAMRPLVPVMSSSGWYHEAETQAADHTRKN